MIEFKLEGFPSNRSFGFLFTGVFILLAGYGAYRGSEQTVVYGWLGAGIFVAFATLLFPKALTPFNKAWFLLGELLGKIVSPVVLGIIFFVLITPTGLLTRFFGRDELRVKKQAGPTYWIDRNPPGPAPDSFKNQF